ncbi:FAS1 domain-containing protein [Dothidotthia symphoricarpi CBS 119687]|uniref:FAS1 domain-containing protein n=1 Tax=Dothidotthia symphoricarpi CBS 119687 TaxID=1392245 RepID=A0A6A6AJ59_9PLEO|nr:FAS1 domain-containing protein [Dothidotthia symphoricarpi CBS 119687]KAF2131138.1 FAS1 domain-containing protein [Dothidotthia symphoricarpi CBS 119687]
MRFARVVPFIPLASAFVITEAEVFEKIDKLDRPGRQVVDNARHVLDNAQNVLDDAFSKVKHGASDAYSKIHAAGCDVESWLEGSFDNFEDEHDHPHPPHHGPPHDGPPHDGPPPPHHGPPPPHHGPPPPHHGPPPPHHGPPHHGKPHHGKPNMTVYELISKSKYTTKLAKLIDKYDDLVETLNSTKANYTIFAPTDEAFEKIPDHGKHPSKEQLKDILLYHVSDDFYPAGRVLHSYTIPTLYEPEQLGHKQRLTVRVTLKGPAINFYAKLVAVDIFGTNGVVHGIDSILVPPPKVAAIIDLLPGEFSTLELALGKTGLFDAVNNTKNYPHEGGTLFAPSNFAFKKLGVKANAFLFSKYGEKYLKALLEYHIVVNQTLYTDAFFDATSKDSADVADRPPYYHFDLPTVLEGKYLAIDVTRYGPFVSIRINGFSRVTVHDGVASDGVIQVVSDVLIPPRNAADGAQVFWEGEELTVEDLKERLQPFVEKETIEL